MAEILEIDEDEVKARIFRILEEYQISKNFSHLSDHTASIKSAVENALMGGIALAGGALAIYKMFQQENNLEALLTLINYGFPIVVAFTLLIHYRENILNQFTKIAEILDSLREPSKEKVISTLIPAIKILKTQCSKEVFQPTCELIKRKILQIDPELLPEIRQVIRELDKKN